MTPARSKRGRKQVARPHKPKPAAGRAASGPRILVVDDAEGIRTYLASWLEIQGYCVDSAENGASALELLEGGAAPDLVLLDVMMPGLDGIETLRRMHEFDPELPVVMLSIVGKTATIVEAMQQGAVDYVSKPIDEPVLAQAIERQLGARGAAFGREVARGDAGAVWHGAAMSAIREVIVQIGDTDVTVLIQGESGVGKEIVARAIHEVSSRAKGPFVKVNCAALPEDLLESELFGYEKGAFTGANNRKPGKFEIASGGSIFLDEIGEMSPGLQAKLLQVLQEKRFARLGGNREVSVDVHVVCATNQPLVQRVAENRFREDLYFRLNVVNIEIPGLRERREEIPALVGCFLRRYSALYHKPPRAPSDRLMAAFARYAFPGNVRELENMIKRVVVLESEDSILEELMARAAGGRGRRGAFEALLREIEETAGEVPLREVGRRAALEVEREAIETALQHTGWNRKQAARLLRVSYKTLLHKIRECELEEGG